MIDQLIEFVRENYRTRDFIPLHAPVFNGRELEYVTETIETSFVSSVGAYVDRFERDIERYTRSPKAVATVNGTAALHIALQLGGVVRHDLVLTQALTFVATCNAISYCGAEPVFLDVDAHTMGLSAQAVEEWLDEHATIDHEGNCRTIEEGRIIRACLPMHTFGHPADIHGLMKICGDWNLILIEDAAESLGSFYHDRHTGTFGDSGVLSFNGNKILTTGGGGMVLTREESGMEAKHLTTTAKQAHDYEYVHDRVGYNYRLPNLNAALGCAQLECLEAFILSKRALATRYREFLRNTDWQFFDEPEHCRSNFWLNAVICRDEVERQTLLTETNRQDVMTRPIWSLMNKLPMYKHCMTDSLRTSEWLEARVVNLPSGVPQHELA